jgi:hypothetical protein
MEAKPVKDLNPDDWKNIALPLVEAIKSLINEINVLNMK